MNFESYWKLKATNICIYTDYLFVFDFVQSTRYVKQKDTSPLQGFSTWHPPTVK